MKKVLYPIILAAVFSAAVSAQNRPLTAVMPFNSKNISQSDASIVSSLFETALVKTESFKVIEQNQVEEILEAQSYTLTGCTDESCAVEFGKLLAAEQIILGEFSRLGERYILNVKVIDVELGENLRADSVSFDSLDRIQEEAEFLAFKLAGLTYARSGSETIATEFGDLFIETDPEGADIFINGMKKGSSPDLFQRVPLGEVVVEARSGSLYGRETVDLQKGIAELSMKLEQTFGNLFIKSTVDEVEVFIDGESYGELGSGLFKNIRAGNRRIELVGDGLYWENEAVITVEGSVVINATPRESGQLTLFLPPGAVASLDGREGTYRLSAQDPGLEHIWAGEYELTVSGKGIKEYKSDIVVEKGEHTVLRPELEITEEGMKYQTEELLASLMDETAEPVSYDEFKEIRVKVTEYYRNLEERGYSELASRVRRLLMDITGKELRKYEDKLSELERRKRDLVKDGTKGKASVPLMILSGVCLASAGVTGYLMADSYSRYQDAQYSDDAVDLRGRTQMFMYISAGTGAAGLTAGVFGLTRRGSDPREREINTEIELVKKQIVELRWLANKLEKEEAA